MLDGCICPGYNISFECTTVGRGITVWKGTAFDCPLSSNEIQLRHTQFLGSIRICNDGDISGYAVAMLPPDCFLSRLIVLITMELNGRTVICRHDVVWGPAPSQGEEGSGTTRILPLFWWNVIIAVL